MFKMYTWKLVSELTKKRYKLYNKSTFFFFTEDGPKTVEGFEFNDIYFYSNGDICFTVDDVLYKNNIDMKTMYHLFNKLIDLEKEI